MNRDIKHRILRAREAAIPTDGDLAELLGDCYRRILQLEGRVRDEKQAADQFFKESRIWQKKYHEVNADLTRRIHDV